MQTVSVDSILIGLGSIGKVHLAELIKRFESVMVVDPDSSVLETINEFNDQTKIYYCKSLDDISFSHVPSFAVIANWGPDHFHAFEAVARLGVTNFLIEKPLVDSFLELDRMRKRIKDGSLKVTSNLQLPYSFLPNLLSELDRDFGIGKPIGLNVIGGAKCVATNGIHFLALANNLFESRPIATIANLRSQAINPRNVDFVFLEGVASWEYLDGRFLTISFLNRSHLSVKCEIIFQSAIATIIGEEITLLGISQEKSLNLSQPTRTAYPTEMLYQGNAFVFPDGTSGLDMVYRRALQDIDSFQEDIGFGAVEDLLAALLSSECNQSAQLPLIISEDDPHFSEKWGIS